MESGILPPNASLSTTNNLTICAGEGIDLTNTSSNATSYFWDFGNNTFSTDVNPTAFYTTTGTYLITLTAIEGAVNNQVSQPITITVIENPIASFTSSSPAYLPNSSIFFTNNSFNNSGLEWDFGDGATSTDSNPWHEYITEGIYTVTLTASNGVCSDSVFTQTVEIIDNLSVTDYINDQIEIYPNPASNQLTINFGSKIENAIINITDLSGKSVKTMTDVSGHKINLTLNNISSGVYFVNISLNEHTTVFKLVVK